MIAFPAGTKIYLACQPVDMRNGFDGLTTMAKRIFDQDPFSSHVFLFRAKRGDYLKILYWDGSGLCLFAKRLERGRFVWPPLADCAQVLTPAQLNTLLEAMDWRRTIPANSPRKPELI